MIYFTSDQHFYHKNSIQFDNRPFKTVEEMNEHIITKWNQKVSEVDTVYILGDVTMLKKQDLVESIINRLKGHIILVKGNHDYFVKMEWAQDLFEEICIYKEINIGEYHICMMHYPLAVWNRKHYGSINLYGHVHSNPEDNKVSGLRYNVGVSVNDYAPVSWDEIKEKLNLNDKEE